MTNLLLHKPVFPHVHAWNNISPFSTLTHRRAFASFQTLTEALHPGSKAVLGSQFQARTQPCSLRVPLVIPETFLRWTCTCTHQQDGVVTFHVLVPNLPVAAGCRGICGPSSRSEGHALLIKPCLFGAPQTLEETDINFPSIYVITTWGNSRVGRACENTTQGPGLTEKKLRWQRCRCQTLWTIQTPCWCWLLNGWLEAMAGFPRRGLPCDSPGDQQSVFTS